MLCVLLTHLSVLFVSLSLIFHDPFDSEFIFFLIKAVFFTIPIAPIFGIWLFLYLICEVQLIIQNMFC